MKWDAVSWFGGVKVECEECHHYCTEWITDDSESLLREQYGDLANPNWDCGTCAIRCGTLHLRHEIMKLCISMYEGPTRWPKLRDTIEKLWWQHPAISNEKTRLHYQRRLQLQARQKQPNDVYIDGKLVGSGTSPEAAEAVRRLMEQKEKKPTPNMEAT
jgi:hypothetical protein